MTFYMTIYLTKIFKKMSLTNVKSIISISLMVLMLTACGFKLRGDYLLAPELQTLYVSSIDKHGELTRIIKQHLSLNQVSVLNKFAKNTSQMHILKDSLDRRTLSVFPNGQVAEYELIYTVRYQLTFIDQTAENFRFELTRDYLDDPDIALAKSRELSLMLREMRVEAADKILRDMATIQR